MERMLFRRDLRPEQSHEDPPKGSAAPAGGLDAFLPTVAKDAKPTAEGDPKPTMQKGFSRGSSTTDSSSSAASKSEPAASAPEPKSEPAPSLAPPAKANTPAGTETAATAPKPENPPPASARKGTYSEIGPDGVRRTYDSSGNVVGGKYAPSGGNASQPAAGEASAAPASSRRSGPSALEVAGGVLAAPFVGIGRGLNALGAIPKRTSIEASFESGNIPVFPGTGSRSIKPGILYDSANPQQGVDTILQTGHRYTDSVPAARYAFMVVGNHDYVQNAAKGTLFADSFPSNAEWRTWDLSIRDTLGGGAKTLLPNALHEEEARAFAAHAVAVQFDKAQFSDMFMKNPNVRSALEHLFMLRYYDQAISFAQQAGNFTAARAALEHKQKMGAYLLSDAINFSAESKRNAGAAAAWAQMGVQALLNSTGMANIGAGMVMGSKKGPGYVDLNVKLSMNPHTNLPLTDIDVAFTNVVLGVAGAAYHQHLQQGKNSVVNFTCGVQAGLFVPTGQSMIQVGTMTGTEKWSIRSEGIKKTTPIADINIGFSGMFTSQSKRHALKWSADVYLPPAAIAAGIGAFNHEYGSVLKDNSPQFGKNWMPQAGIDLSYQGQIGRFVSKVGEGLSYRIGTTGVLGNGYTPTSIYGQFGFEGPVRGKDPILGIFWEGDLKSIVRAQVRGSPIAGLMERPLDNRFQIGYSLQYITSSGFGVMGSISGEAREYAGKFTPTISAGISFTPRFGSKSQAVNEREFERPYGN